MTSTRSVDSDPELFHGLTTWCGEPGNVRVSAQIRGDGGASVPEDLRTGTQLALYIGAGADISTEDGHPALLPADDARALRDLLNIATARGYL